MIEITQEKLERYVPSFADSTDAVFVSMRFYLECAAETVDALAGSTGLSGSLLGVAERYAYRRGAYEAIPSMDLILTPTGFGVVSNQNVAPASRDRVEKLRESLRQSADDALYGLVSSLRSTDWADSERAFEYIHSLMWSPELYRNAGITLNGKKVYRDEMQELAAQTAEAEVHIFKIIGEDLYAELVTQERHARLSGSYRDCADWVRRVMASHIMKMPDTEKLAASLMKFVEDHADVLVQYRNSSLYASRHYERRENEPQDCTYFW